MAIVWGVGGVALLYTIANWLVESLGGHWRARIQPFIFVGPALAIFLLVPRDPHRPYVLHQPL